MGVVCCDLAAFVEDNDISEEDALEMLRSEMERRRNAGRPSKTQKAIDLIEEGVNVEDAIERVDARSPNTKAKIRKQSRELSIESETIDADGEEESPIGSETIDADREEYPCPHCGEDQGSYEAKEEHISNCPALPSYDGNDADDISSDNPLFN